MEGFIDVAAQTLPNLMSMIGMFIQERRHQKDLTHNEFLEWLDAHRFDELKRIITATHGLNSEIDELLKIQQEQILDELKVISSSINLMASRMEILGKVSQLVSPQTALSEQSVWMLQKLDQEKGPRASMYTLPSIGGISLVIGQLMYDTTEMKFIKDDFDSLTALGLISVLRYNNGGQPIFGITRRGAAFVQKLPPLPPEENAEVV